MIFEDLRMVRTAHSPGLSFRDQELVKDGDEALLLMIAQSGRLDLAHQGRELRLGRDETTLLRMCETASAGSRHAFECIAVMIPPGELAARSARPDDAIMRRVPRQSETLQLLRAYIRALEGARLAASAQTRETIRRHIIDLVALICTPHGALGETDLSAVADARLHAALEHITTRFQDPALSVVAVAKSQGISVRYLQGLLETSGRSFTERVTELRLQKAFALLTEAGEDARRISDIALEAGFSDISHFNRLFRARFGDTPSAVRSGAMGRKGV
jgi:AraC-like DNA-binding protein